MTRLNLFALFIMTLALLLGYPPATHAAGSHDSCTGYVTALPASIDTPGVWCLSQNLSSASSSAGGITINASDVTLDCNGFQLDNLAAGPGTSSTGVGIASNLQRTTVRHCVVTGYCHGLFDGGGSKLTIEDNHFDRNICSGIWASSYHTVIRHNRVSNTGSGLFSDPVMRGIGAFLSADILDNTVTGVADTSASSDYVVGILAEIDAGSVNGNRVRGVKKNFTQQTMAIGSFSAARFTMRDNEVIGDGSAGVAGLHCEDARGRFKNNVINGFVTATENCGNAGGNDISN